MVLRPTGIGTIGRSVLSPDVRNGASEVTLLLRIIRCICWDISCRSGISVDGSTHRHFSLRPCRMLVCASTLQRKIQYLPRISHARHHSDGAPIRSRRACSVERTRVSHAERVFQEAGTFPVHVVTRSNRMTRLSIGNFMRMSNPDFRCLPRCTTQSHAMAVVGYEWRSPAPNPITRMRYAWDEVKSLAVVDDNHLPYQPIRKAAERLTRRKISMPSSWLFLKRSFIRPMRSIGLRLRSLN